MTRRQSIIFLSVYFTITLLLRIFVEPMLGISYLGSLFIGVLFLMIPYYLYKKHLLKL